MLQKLFSHSQFYRTSDLNICEALQSHQNNSNFQDYFCCGLEDNQIVREATSEHGRPQRFIAYGSSFQ